MSRWPILPQTQSDPRRTAFAVLAVCCVLNAASRGLTDSFVAFVLPLSHGFGWDRAAVVSIQSIAMLSTGLAAPLAGRMFDRLGPRAVYALGLGLIGAGMILASAAEALWHFQLCLGIGAGIGTACLGNAPHSALVSRWFRPRLAIAMSVLWSAAGIGVLVLVPLAQLLIERHGWAGAYRWMGGAALLATVPVLLLPWRRFAGSGAPAEAGQSAPADRSAPAPEEWTLRRAVRHSAFWGLAAVFLFTSAGMFAVIVQVVAYLVEIGFAPLRAAGAWGISGMLLPVGMIVFGWLDSRIGRRPSVFLSYALSLSGIVALWLLGRYPSTWLLGVFIVLFGGTTGSRGPLIATIAMHQFHGRNVGTIFGTITIGAGLGAAFGSWFGGLLHDWSGGYDLVLYWAFFSIVCGQLPFWLVPSLRGSRPRGGIPREITRTKQRERDPPQQHDDRDM